KRRLCIAARCIDCPPQEGFLLSDTSANALAASGHRPMGFPEFVIVIASIMALNPIAMDMMLPALPNIASAFHITAANRPQMVLAMMVFIAVPVVAPAFGQAVLMLTQWRGIFIVLMLYGVVAFVWSALRMPETLPEERRRSLAIGEVLDAFRQTVTNRQTLGYALV